MAGACLFTYLSMGIDPPPARARRRWSRAWVSSAPARSWAAVTRSRTPPAASVWLVAAIGMVIALGWYLIAAIATVYAIIVPRIPHVKTWLKEVEDE
jgi:putative Mg2+ transporter-C (MgtC) family protein